MNYTKKYNTTWDFYLKNKDKLIFCGEAITTKINYSKDGVSPKEYFYILDTYGESKALQLECNDPTLVIEILRFKKSLNFHIKMWCEGFNDCIMPISDYLSLLKDCPDWVYKAFKNQLMVSGVNGQHTRM